MKYSVLALVIIASLLSVPSVCIAQSYPPLPNPNNTGPSYPFDHTDAEKMREKYEDKKQQQAEDKARDARWQADQQRADANRAAAAAEARRGRIEKSKARAKAEGRPPRRSWQLENR